MSYDNKIKKVFSLWAKQWCKTAKAIFDFINIVSNYIETQLEKNVTIYTDLDEFRLQHSGSLTEGFNDGDINVLFSNLREFIAK